MDLILLSALFSSLDDGMPHTAFSSLICPLDDQPLHDKGATWYCQSGHSFDVARQGYLNLLPVQNKRSRAPGDSKEMVAARQRFLASAAYRPVALRLAELLAETLPSTATISLLDAGCGEGYYLRQVLEHLADKCSIAAVGLDISKAAVMAAAKQDKQSRYLVASNANIPLPTASLDRIVCLFGFPVYSEFQRVLKPEGEIIMVDPGPEHLLELRNIVYPQQKEKAAAAGILPDGLRQVHNETLSYELSLPTAASIMDLLAMTPHLYRASAAGRQQAEQLTQLAVTVDVRFSRIAKASPC